MKLPFSGLFIRIISRNGDVYFLKIITLAIAFATSLVVILFSMHEFGYDTSHKDADQVYRLLTRNTDKDYPGNRLSALIPNVVLKNISQSLGDRLTVSRVKALNKVTMLDPDGRVFHDQSIYAADPSIHGIFSFDVVEGKIEDFVGSRNVVAIASKRARSRYFENQPAVGSSIRLTTFGDTINVVVVAVFDDFPSNTHEDFDFFISYDPAAISTLNFDGEQSGAYARAADDLSPNSLAGAIDDHSEYLVQPIGEIYFGPRVASEESRHGDSYTMAILICIVFLIFLLAICSFVNLSAITLPYRSKEIAVKKLAGATQRQLLRQFVNESFALTSVSLLIGVMILSGASRYLNAAVGVDIIQLFGNISLIFLAIIGVMIFAVVLSPVFMVIRFVHATPQRLLSTDAITFPQFKRTITVVQFGVSMFLIASSVMLGRQINYSLTKEPGRNHEQILYMASPPNIPDSAVHRIKAGWPDIDPHLNDAIAISQLPNQLKARDAGSGLFVLEADYNFKDFFQFTMLDGAWFEYTDKDSVMVVNQKALKRMSRSDRDVIGVIQDLGSPFNQPEQPVKILNTRNINHNWICFRVDEVNIRNTVQWIERRMRAKGSVGNAHFLNPHFELWLNYQDRLNALSRMLTIISVLLAGFAIYGLTVNLVRDKMKEITVHRLLGARLSDITRLLARGLLRQLFLAVVIFGPISYVLLNELLRTFVYATEFSWKDPVYPVAYCVVVIIGLCAYQAIRLGTGKRKLK